MVEPSTSNRQKGYASVREADSFLGYNRDYVTCTAPEGKVESKVKNGKWFIDMDSLKYFSLETAERHRLAACFVICVAVASVSQMYGKLAEVAVPHSG